MHAPKGANARKRQLQMKKFFVILFATLLAVQCTLSQQRTSTADSATLSSAICLADSVSSWLHFLASDDMRGRANGSPEIEIAAQWLTEKFEYVGLQPVCEINGFVQAYFLNNDSSFVHKNIIGYFPASNEQDSNTSFIVISAHFDHIGIARNPVNGDSIFNGADDNASGVVAMLAIAKKLYRMNAQTNHPILFTAFSNEEVGIRGSRYFVESGFIPMQQVKLNINLEMLGRSHEFGRNKFYITGPSQSNFQDIVVAFNEGTDWEIEDVGPVAESLFRRSDNISFFAYAERNNFCIPAHTVATSVGTGHIHRVYDEVEFIDFENLNNIIAHLTQLILHISNSGIAVMCN